MLWCVEIFQDDNEKIVHASLNNDLFAINDSSVADDILYRHKDKIFGQKEICSE
ncbi:MAG: hypothetical protein ACR5KW_03865 [Wolbachia sp.]